MNKIRLFVLILIALPLFSLAQHSDESARIKQLILYQDSLAKLGREMVNNPNDPERKNANYAFIKMLVKALKTQNSFLFQFDSLKTISILNSPDNRFRIFSWPLMNQDGSYRYYGTIQMNTGGPLLMHPLEDYSPLLTSPEDSVTDNRKWYGAQYYKIIPMYGNNPHYILLGWKGHTVKSTKKVIEVLTFKNAKPVFGMPVFTTATKTRNRIVFEYARQVSMLLKYVPDEQMIVFDHLSAPDKKLKDKPETFGPDLSYDAYRLNNGKWTYVENLDMRNVSGLNDVAIEDPKKQAIRARQSLPVKRNN
jgi:hypothetical protein